MELHSTHMKRIVAKEFLLLVGCVVIVLLVAFFGWLRNAWFNHRIESFRGQSVEQIHILDSLSAYNSPTKHEFVDLFDSAYVAQNVQLLLTAPTWTKGLDPFRELNRVYVAQLAKTLNATGYLNRSTSTRLENISEQERSIIDLGRELKVLYPSEFGSMADKVVGISAVHESPVAFSSVNTLGNPFWQYEPETQRSIALCSARLRLHLLKSVNATTDGPLYQGDYIVVRLADSTVVEFPREMTVAEVVDAIVGLEPKEGLMRTHQLLETDRLRMWIEARRDSSLLSPSYQLARVLISDSNQHAELRMAHGYLVDKSVLGCTFNELLFTMQRKPVPPTQEALDVFAKQRTTVNELRKKENDARASLWSEAKQLAVLKWVAIVLLVLIYPLRLFVLGTHWALRTLRT